MFRRTATALLVCFFNSSIDMYGLASHAFNPFNIYDSVAFSIPTEYCILELSDLWRQLPAYLPCVCVHVYVNLHVCPLVCVHDGGRGIEPPGRPDLPSSIVLVTSV